MTRPVKAGFDPRISRSRGGPLTSIPFPAVYLNLPVRLSPPGVAAGELPVWKGWWSPRPVCLGRLVMSVCSPAVNINTYLSTHRRACVSVGEVGGRGEGEGGRGEREREFCSTTFLSE